MIRTFALLALMAGLALAQQAVPEVKTLNRTELDRLLATPEKILILDVRRPDEIASIGGFPAYLSIQAPDLEKYLSAIPKDHPIITVSNHAVRATRAAQLLLSRGYPVAGAVGAQTYEEEGGHLTKVKPPQVNGSQK